MNMETSNATPIGYIATFVLSAVLAASAFWWVALLVRRVDVALLVGLCCFAILYCLLLQAINIRRYTFDVASREILVENIWLRLFDAKRSVYSFSDVEEIRIRTFEMSYLVVTLRSGEKLYPRSGGTKNVRDFCEKLAEAMGKHRVFPGQWR